MHRVRMRQWGALKRVPRYCYPSAERFPTRFLFALCAAIGWLWFLNSQVDRSGNAPEAHSAPVAVEVSLVIPSSDSDSIGAVTRPDPVTASSEVDPRLAAVEVEPRAACVSGAMDTARSPRSPFGLPGRDPIGEPPVPSGVPSSPANETTGETSHLGRASGAIDAVAEVGDAGSGVRWLWSDLLDTSPVKTDCLHLCGRGPPSAREIA